MPTSMAAAHQSPPRTESYGARVRAKLKSADNAQGRSLTLRELARLTGYSYEHVRKVMLGEPVGSVDFNRHLSQALGLDPDEMWQLALYEKAQRKYGAGSSLARVALPPEHTVAMLWEKLSEESRRQVVTIMEGLAARDEVARTLATVTAAKSNEG